MKQPVKHTGVFSYAGKEIIPSLWLIEGNEPPDTILFLGVCQTVAIGKWVSQAAGEGLWL